MNGRFNTSVRWLNKKIGLHITISFGIFLFILFFQPFPLDRFDFNNRLLFVAGFGAIVFFIMIFVRFFFLLGSQRNNQNADGPVSAFYLSGFIILALCSVSFAFYLRYVGSVNISFFIIFKVVLICLVPPVILKLYDRIIGLIQQNESLVSERKIIQRQIERYEEDNLNKSVEFVSETINENLTLVVADVLFIRSADNYVEIVFMDGGEVQKKLIRNTLKNTELLIKKYSNFIRCHRTFIINMHYIEKLNHDYSSHWLTLRGYHERIPVSRQYLLKLREAL